MLIKIKHMSTVNAYATINSGEKLVPYTYELPEIGNEEVDVKVLYCGVCHSDISMIDNSWGMSQYPLVGGHEIIGQVTAVGSHAKGIKVGDYVGVGWSASSCMHCSSCMQGSQHLCSNVQATIVGRHGGFSDQVRAHWSWTIVLPKGINLEKAGPLLCGGITVFNPILISEVKPTDKVGVIGIGGLGHLALKFLNKWGCEVIAFSSSENKKDDILAMGATKVINSRKPEELETIAGSLDFIISTVNVSLDWNAYLQTLAPKGKLHVVGASLEPMQIPAFTLIGGEKTLGGSPTGSPSAIKTMLDFSVRHNIYPTVEAFDMKEINKAIQHLRDGNARYRVVLKA